jgi:hypothetical protein
MIYDTQVRLETFDLNGNMVDDANTKAPVKMHP